MITSHRRKSIGRNLAEAAQIFDNNGMTHAAELADSCANSVIANFAYQFLVSTDGVGSQSLNGIYMAQFKVVGVTIKITVWAEGAVHSFAAKNEGQAASVLERLGGEDKTRVRIQSYPVDGSRQSGPQTEIMMGVEPMPYPEKSQSVDVDPRDKGQGRFGSSNFDKEAASDYVLSLKKILGSKVHSAIRPAENTVVLTAGSDGALITFLPSKRGVKFKVQTNAGIRKRKANSLKEFKTIIEDIL